MGLAFASVGAVIAGYVVFSVAYLTKRRVLPLPWPLDVISTFDGDYGCFMWILFGAFYLGWIALKFIINMVILLGVLLLYLFVSPFMFPFAVAKGK